MAGSRWVRLDVDYFDHPKVLVAGRDGRDLHLASICWSARHLTDGHIPSEALPALARMAGLDVRHAVNGLDKVTDAGLWIPTATGYEVHNYTAKNVTRDEFNHERDAWRERQRRHRTRDQNGRYTE